MSDQKSILIVNDDLDMCVLLKHYFLRQNYKVHFAHTIKNGIQLYKDIAPDLIYIGDSFQEEWDKKIGLNK